MPFCFDAVEWNPTFTQNLIDDFETDPELDAYTATTGTLSDWDVLDEGQVTVDAVSGNEILQAYDTGGGTPGILSDTGLDNYPQRGDEFEFYAAANDVSAASAEVNMRFAVTDDAEYRVGINFDAAQIDLDYVPTDGGSTGFVDIIDSSKITDDTWYRIAVDFGKTSRDTISITVTNMSTGEVVSSFSRDEADDDAWAALDHGDVGWSARTNGSLSYLDAGRMLHTSTRRRSPTETPTVADTVSASPVSQAMEDFDTTTTPGGDPTWPNAYTNDTGDYSTQIGTVHGGNAALQRDATDFNASVISTSGLPAYPEQGDEFEAYVNTDSPNSQMDVTVTFGVQDINNGYGMKLDMNSDYITIVEGTSGVPVTWTEQNGTTAFTFAGGTWYRCHMQWDDGSTFGGSVGEMTFTVEEDGNPSNSASHTYTDTTNTDGGIGFTSDISDHGGVCYFDDAILL